MLDIKWIRNNQEEVQTVADRKGIAISISQLVEVDDARRRLQQDIDELRQERNQTIQEINLSIYSSEEKDVEQKKLHMKEINQRIASLETEQRAVQAEYADLMQVVPNIVSPDTPIGKSDQDNVEVRRVGEPPGFGFEIKDHVKLGELHQMINIPRGVKTAGSRNYYLTGAGAALHRAVQQLALDLLMARGFTLLEVPLMVRKEALFNTGFFPLGEEQTYRIDGGDKYLVGTSEVPLISFYDNEIVDVSKPIRLAAASTCFRSEVGSAGKDVHGLYRVHQFSKVEQVIICEDSIEASERMLQEITQNAEDLLQQLELPYRVMAVCTGDMSQKTYKQFDIETWMPSRQAYGETHSSSNLLDFQARRSNIRYRDAQGKLRFCHTLNNTAVASPRILIPLLETHQEEDGSIRIPEALRKYMNGMKKLQL
ncbi:serine--tRNA ligase [Paenibacillus glycanilyticus]|uniref:Serine--tRNA ligase n=1 Tax=Paenibacillus glycanilyticus TaxID=126569 RepID=A0ABQ6NHM4_9BACL|nr:serine--tRNA ligase [Paenibacillus glycanilyticus]GMK43702.1 serine--tRNA ligase [Paenibacillus glycanilyticus]